MDTVVQAEPMQARAEMPGVIVWGWYISLEHDLAPAQPVLTTRSIMIGGASISAIPNPVGRKALVEAAA